MSRGKVVGSDETTDLAVLKVDSEQSLTATQLGNSDNPKGWSDSDFGNPFGLTEDLQ